jgi:hypothetical protein
MQCARPGTGVPGYATEAEAIDCCGRRCPRTRRCCPRSAKIRRSTRRRNRSTRRSNRWIRRSNRWIRSSSNDASCRSSRWSRSNHWSRCRSPTLRSVPARRALDPNCLNCRSSPSCRSCPSGIRCCDRRKKTRRSASSHRWNRLRCPSSSRCAIHRCFHVRHRHDRFACCTSCRWSVCDHAVADARNASPVALARADQDAFQRGGPRLFPKMHIVALLGSRSWNRKRGANVLRERDPEPNRYTRSSDERLQHVKVAGRAFRSGESRMRVGSEAFALASVRA